MIPSHSTLSVLAGGLGLGGGCAAIRDVPLKHLVLPTTITSDDSFVNIKASGSSDYESKRRSRRKRENDKDPLLLFLVFPVTFFIRRWRKTLTCSPKNEVVLLAYTLFRSRVNHVLQILCKLLREPFIFSVLPEALLYALDEVVLMVGI